MPDLISVNASIAPTPFYNVALCKYPKLPKLTEYCVFDPALHLVSELGWVEL